MSNGGLPALGSSLSSERMTMSLSWPALGAEGPSSAAAAPAPRESSRTTAAARLFMGSPLGLAARVGGGPAARQRLRGLLLLDDDLHAAVLAPPVERGIVGDGLAVAPALG